MSTEPSVRGYIIASPLTFIEEAYDPAARAAIFDRLPPATRDVVRAVKEVEWYPRRHVVALYTALADHHRATDGKVTETFLAMGRAAASRAIATFLQLVMKVMTVEVYARKVAEIWQRDHREGRLEMDTSQLANKRLVFRLLDVKGYDFIGGAFPGFQATMLTAIGCKDLEYECDWRVEDPGPETVTCHFRWK